MNRTPRTVVLFAILALGVPAAAQDPDPGVGPQRLERVAKLYAAEQWPASAAPRLGLDPASVTLRGWTQQALRRDAQRAAATVSFARGGFALAQLELRRHETVGEARQALLHTLNLCQATLSRRAGVGDLAFATPGESVSYVTGTCGNLSFVLRSLEPKLDLTPLLADLDGALRAAPPCEPGVDVPRPRVVAVELAEVAPRGTPTPFSLDLDPGAPEVAALSVRCTGDASVLQTETGFELYPAGPGPVVVTVRLCTADLRVGEHRFKLVVP